MQLYIQIHSFMPYSYLLFLHIKSMDGQRMSQNYHWQSLVQKNDVFYPEEACSCNLSGGKQIRRTNFFLLVIAAMNLMLFFKPLDPGKNHNHNHMLICMKRHFLIDFMMVTLYVIFNPKVTKFFKFTSLKWILLSLRSLSII